MGSVTVKVKLWNFLDEVKAKEGLISEEQIRTVEVEDALVDTGAILVSLPEDIVEKLGLMIEEEKYVTLANNHREKRKIAAGLKIEIMGRTSETRCIVNDKGTKVLIGQIPLEEMDLYVFPAEGRIGGRPEHPDSPLIDMYSLDFRRSTLDEILKFKFYGGFYA